MPSDWKHHRSVIALLDQFYCWKSTLREYFEYVFMSYNVNEKSRKAVFSGGSIQLEYLLNGTIICCSCDVIVVPSGLKLFDAFCYHHELVRRVIDVNCQKRNDTENVLSRGFSSCRHASRRDLMPGSIDIQIDHPNTVTSYMCSEMWQDLCSRIGCDLMMHVLQNMSMFHKMAKGNLVQISGTVVDRSKIKDRNHRCSGQIVQFLQHLPLLDPRALVSRSKGSPENKDNAFVHMNSVEFDHIIDQIGIVSSDLANENGSISSNCRASTPVIDPLKFNKTPSTRTSPFDEDTCTSSLSPGRPVEPLKISAERAHEIRWLWEVVAGKEVVPKHGECSDDTTLSPEIPFSPPPRMRSRLRSVRTQSKYDREVGTNSILQPPYKRKWQMEDHDESVLGMSDKCIEECNSNTTFEKDSPPVCLKHEFVGSKELEKENIDTGLGDREEELEDSAPLSPEIPYSPPRKYSRVNSSCFKLNYECETDSRTLFQGPFDRMPQMRSLDHGLASKEDASCIETEGSQICTNLARDFRVVLSKQEIMVKEDLRESNAPSGLENGEICDKDCVKISCMENDNPPLDFENGNRFDVSSRGNGGIVKVDGESNVQDRQQRDWQLNVKKLLKGNVNDARENRASCGEATGRECEEDVCNVKMDEDKEDKKQYATILNEFDGMKKDVKLKPMETGIDERFAFRMRKIMYSKHLREGLRSSHILNNVRPSNKGAHILGLHIFCSIPKSSASRTKDAKCQFEQGSSVSKLPKNLRRSLPMLRQLINDYKKLKISKHLARHCPSSKEIKKLRQCYNLHRKRLIKDPSLKFNFEEQKTLYDTALKDCIPPYKIFLFVKSVCTDVLPTALLQSKSNWKTFFNNLRPFFTLGKHEFLTLSMVMRGIKCSHCTWTYRSRKRLKPLSRSFSTWQRSSIEALVLWIVADFVMPLLRSCFYVTEIGKYRQKAFYFRRGSWAAMERLAGDTFLRKNFSEVGRDVVTEAISKEYTLGCGKMRVIPKANKLRPIINMRCARKKFSAPVSLNYQVDRLLHVLKFLARDKPQLFGSAVSDLEDINFKLRRFRRLITEVEINEPNIYFVASDIECCFDSIPHCKLMDVAKSAMEEKEYIIRKFSATSFVMFRDCLTVTNRVATSKGTEFFPVFIDKHLKSKDCTTSNSIITDGVFYAKERRDMLHNSLWKHIKQSYVKFGSRCYRLIRDRIDFENEFLSALGIAQGSMISTYLCNLLYGHMERTHLDEFLNSDECLLMRWTDDYLLITTSKHLAQQFLEKLKAGFPEYGCSINLEKSRTNLSSEATCQTNIIQHLDETWFPWCNLLINTQTLEVRFSYDRYLGKSVGDSFSVRLDSRPGRRLISRMMQHVRFQTAAIVVDPALNSRQNILTNVYQIFSFIAIKFNCHVINLPKDGQPNARPKFFCLAVHCVFKAFYRQYRRVHEKVCSYRVPLISKAEMKSLYYTAVLNVLKRKKTRYIELIRLIRRTAKKYKTKQIDVAKIKQESAVFDRIK